MSEACWETWQDADQVQMDNRREGVNCRGQRISADRIKPTRVTVSEITVTDGKYPGFVEVRFPCMPEVQVRDALKSARFRWSRFNGCWYGRADKLPEMFSKYLPPV